ncbi:N-acetylglucosamine/diacetylchitobiose ABC transporter substrate-binding protein [Nonomuraea diastatica]|uniref:Carbohydrate ABC transporter, N-acetylglucosamine/diacetylchitobiose-binding protein n=1 Tax=Nonomuraea diastatica TaxID=1848329 RepID=A0A4V2YDM4_9ACTN|nr:N-acetylglucosamine/diacetylchitobiose ABC transporter substrate-binding protein [Nonomuraea diastatica]TDD15896.1 carbohydrate ABC transporter, N-acetylglucosamine/diacetylchitobiose-binding protein [Nonomuraea diastatica]
MHISSQPSRRHALCLLGASLLSGCAMGGGDTSAPAKAPAGKITADNPFGVPDGGSVELAYFKGGSPNYLGDAVEPLLQNKFPKVQIQRTMSERMSQTLQPRFVGGNPPDFIDNAGADALSFGALVQDGQVLDLTDFYNAPSIDDPSKKIKDSLLPGSYESTLVDGVPYTISFVARSFGIWYNAKLGLQPPATWDAFIQLCEEIKKSGVTPYGFAGKNAADYQAEVILTSAAKIGGLDLLRAIDNLEDGAWEADAVRQAAEAWAEIGGRFSDKSFEGLIHTEVQLRQNQGKLAFYPCGDWLESEQKKSTPEGFEYTMMPTPSITSSDALPIAAVHALLGSAMLVAAKGQNTAAAQEFMRLMVSKEGARAYTRASGWLTTVPGAADGLDLSPGTLVSQQALATAGAAKALITWKWNGWYQPLLYEIRDATNALMYGRVTAAEFTRRMQKKADEIKADSTIKKYQR